MGEARGKALPGGKTCMKSITTNIERASQKTTFDWLNKFRREKINLLSKVLQNCVACSDLALPEEYSDAGKRDGCYVPGRQG